MSNFTFDGTNNQQIGNVAAGGIGFQNINESYTPTYTFRIKRNSDTCPLDWIIIGVSFLLCWMLFLMFFETSFGLINFTCFALANSAWCFFWISIWLSSSSFLYLYDNKYDKIVISGKEYKLSDIKTTYPPEGNRIKIVFKNEIEEDFMVPAWSKSEAGKLYKHLGDARKTFTPQV